MRVLVLNGPNLGRLGRRQPEIYGSTTHDQLAGMCRDWGAALGLDVEVRQTNHEGEMLDRIHAARETAAGLVVNPGAWSHTSVALLDALNAFEGPVIEVHISQIHRREAFRHHSYVSHRADAVIAGCGVQGYALAMLRMRALLGEG